jgi:hypothetical protein
MPDESPYDEKLTAALQSELDSRGGVSAQETTGLGRLVERLEGEFRRLFDDDEHRDRVVGYLRGVAKLPQLTATPSQGPVRETLVEMVSMSSRLDQTAEPSEGLATAETVGRRAHELLHTIESFLPALRPSELITDAFHRLSAYLSRLIKNVVVRVRQFAKSVDATSFSIGFSLPPPSFSVSLTFG